MGQGEDFFEILGLGASEALELALGQQLETVVRRVAVEKQRVDVGGRDFRQYLPDGAFDADAP
jgi:hypothetical protein